MYLTPRHSAKGLIGLYIYCRSGRRSHDAAMKMKDKGFKVADMKGGIIARKEAGMPICTDQCNM